MTTAPEIRIAANDSTLAHAMAYGQIKKLRDETQKLVDRLQSLQGKTRVRQGAKLLREHFGKLLLIEEAIRLKGSRPRGWWLALDASVDGGSDMVVVLMDVDKDGWQCRDLMLRLSSHAVARLMQRTTGSSCLQRFAEALRVHIFGVLPMAHRATQAQRITTYGGTGAMVWLPYEGGLRATTWLAVESMADESLARLCRKQGMTHLGVRVEEAHAQAL
jgi:hypothetical protein